MSDTTTCASGCTTRGQHTTDCGDDKCRGCLPRPTDTGTLCAWCYQRLTADIHTAPDLVAHLRDLGEPHAAMQPPSDGKSYRDPAETGIIPPAWQAADEIHANLASWVLLILEEHPDGQRMVGPDQAGAWLTKYGAVAGVRVPAATTALVTWLTPWLPWCAGRDWAAEMRSEVGELIATTSARWPLASMVEKERPIPMPCPACEHLSLTYAPPSFYKQAFKVSCSSQDCARVWSEDEWEWLVNMVAKGVRA